MRHFTFSFCLRTVGFSVLGFGALLFSACAGPKMAEPIGTPILQSNWPNTVDRVDADFLSALRAAQDFMARQSPERTLGPKDAPFTAAEYHRFLAELGDVLEARQQEDLPLLPFLQSACDLWRLSPGSAPEWLFEQIPWPQVEASHTRNSRHNRPILGRPRDLVEVRLDAFRDRFPNLEWSGLTPEGDLSALPQAIYGKRQAPAPGADLAQIVPYASREEILKQTNSSKTSVLAWVEEAAETALQEREGGTLRFSNGEEWKLGFDADNGFPTPPARHVFFRRITAPESRWGAKQIPERTVDLADIPVPLGALVYIEESTGGENGRFWFGLARSRTFREQALARIITTSQSGAKKTSGNLYWLVPNQISLTRIREKYKTSLSDQRIVE